MLSDEGLAVSVIIVFFLVVIVVVVVIVFLGIFFDKIESSFARLDLRAKGIRVGST
jgi:hypothetical protein